MGKKVATLYESQLQTKRCLRGRHYGQFINMQLILIITNTMSISQIIHRGKYVGDIRIQQRREWTAILEDFLSTELSIQEYCDEHNICISTFYRWCKQLHQMAAWV